MDNLTIDENSFNKKARELHKISEKLNDNWEINEKSEKLYLSKRILVVIKNEQKPPELDVEAVDCEDIAAAPSNASEVISIEYHVLFHPSYQVPVLYFNAYSDSSLIKLEDIPKIFVRDFENDESRNEMRDMITQAEHPILFKPYFMLHPCKVNEVLAKFPQSKNYVLTYLTIYGPSVRLKMNPDYEKFFY